MIRDPFPHQSEAIARLRDALRSGTRRVMLAAPTGAGKTFIASMVVDGALARGKRVLIVVPVLSLVQQTIEALAEEGIRCVGVIQGADPRFDIEQPVQVATVQTLMKRKIPPADVVLIDEAHVVFQFYATWMNDPAWAAIPFIGLSATPWTKGLGKLYETLISVRTIAELIDAKRLSPFRVFAPSHPDLRGVKTVAGDYHEGELAEAMSRGSLVADVVSTWLARGEDRPTLCFGVNRAHAKLLQRQFEHAEVPTGYADAHTTLEEREEVRRRFHAGELKVVCNIATLTTGIDWDVRCIILARPTKSRMLYVQIVGRGLRTASEKQDLLLLDHSDTTLRLGFVTDIVQDHLDDGKGRGPAEIRVRDEALPKECPSCAFLKPPKMALCPSCGFRPERQSKVACEDGELFEVTGKGKGKSPGVDRATKQRWFSMLTHVGRQKQYASGWVKHQYRERFGVWPVDLSHNPMVPDREVLNWLKSQTIRFAKGRATSRPQQPATSQRRAMMAALSTFPASGRAHGR